MRRWSSLLACPRVQQEQQAKADEALKAKERSEEEAKKRKEEDQATLVEQVKRVKEIEAIESDSFVPQTFRSSKEVKKVKIGYLAVALLLQEYNVDWGCVVSGTAMTEKPFGP
ncbi:serine arginine-related protein 53 [Limosa lapponica baueri]|uniref:Serine arginine-related protein 53 n=1 Tax=Limosa lapponica baueri TaxID=1758121 RepID=A0A2I0TZ56_LIMLA|nr:serine arginine-related protein 53 [Limosa lapponica baueri]